MFVSIKCGYIPFILIRKDDNFHYAYTECTLIGSYNVSYEVYVIINIGKESKS